MSNREVGTKMDTLGQTINVSKKKKRSTPLSEKGRETDGEVKPLGLVADG